ncbi:helix-turn-helix transcriptional regulator [Methanobrevibacter sp. DSM 116169]|uniref:helix-turn-helix transcriptional regulator n=1 Tax=Methanobrevibacter sp. DSM 116169 TaxID=3242727 RepID=UPI0038FC4EB5
MVTINGFKDLNTIEAELKFLAKSEIRLRILNSLQEKPMTIREIVDYTSLTYSSISSNIGKLDKRDFIYKKNGKYHTNSICNVYLKNILEFNKLIKLITNFNKFWNNHTITEIDSISLMDITSLNNSKIIESTSIDIYKPHNHMKKLIKNSNKLKVIFPYLHPDYPEIIEELLKNGAKIEIIIPKNIEKHLFDNINKNLIKEAIKNKKLKIKSINKNLNLSLTINDKNMSLGLFKVDGTYDQNRLLSSKDPIAIDWALDLFEHINNNPLICGEIL